VELLSERLSPKPPKSRAEPSANIVCEHAGTSVVPARFSFFGRERSPSIWSRICHDSRAMELPVGAASAPAAPQPIPPRMRLAAFATKAEYRAYADLRRKCLEAQRDQERDRKGRARPKRDRERAEREAEREALRQQEIRIRYESFEADEREAFRLRDGQLIAPSGPIIAIRGQGLAWHFATEGYSGRKAVWMSGEGASRWINPWHPLTLTPTPGMIWAPDNGLPDEDYDAWARHLEKHGLIAGSKMQLSSEEKSLAARGRTRRHSV
jgi:hypothetical protein